MLMPPRKAVRPSTISSLRWSRWFSSQSLRVTSGLSGLNTSTCDAAGRPAGEEGGGGAERADAVPDQVDLHALPLLGDQRLHEALADLVVVQDVGLHVDVVARRRRWPPAWRGRWPGRPGAAARGCRWSAGCRRWPPPPPGGARRCRSPGCGSCRSGEDGAAPRGRQRAARFRPRPGRRATGSAGCRAASPGQQAQGTRVGRRGCCNMVPRLMAISSIWVDSG
jgi:hypothetical protein